jgi:hypothetical protein
VSKLSEVDEPVAESVTSSPRIRAQLRKLSVTPENYVRLRSAGPKGPDPLSRSTPAAVIPG